MKVRRALLGVLAVIVAWLLAPPTWAQDGKPAIRDFKFDPVKARYDDALQYTFAYQNFPGGLATIRDAEMWVWWQRPGDRPVRSRFVPDQEELAKHPTESGVFVSRKLRWRPPERAPYGGVEVQYILKFTLANGQEVTATATFNFAD
jgi:hypothetical protein